MLNVWLAKGLTEAAEVASTATDWVAIETEYGDEVYKTNWLLQKHIN